MEKSYSWEDMANLTHATQVNEFGFCTCEDNDGEENPYADCPKKETQTFTMLSGNIIEIQATSEAEAWEALSAGQYEVIEALSEMREKPCTACSDPAQPGWHADDDAGITFGGLKKAQNESADDMAQWIAHIFFTKSTEVFNDLMYLIVDKANAGERFSSYSERCEWEA